MRLVGDRGATIIGFTIALAMLAAIFWLIGANDVVSALSVADAGVVSLMVPVAVAWLGFWGLALRFVLSSMDVEIAPLQAILTLAAAVFANNVTPFGQAGGEPVTAYVISSSSDAEYETGLAAIASVDALHFVPTVGFATVGLAYFATQITFGRQLWLATGAVAVLVVVAPLAAYVGWRYRQRVEAALTSAIAPIAAAIGTVLPGRTIPSAADIRQRVNSFFDAISRIATDRRRLAMAMGFSALGWLGIMISLWLGLYAVGHSVSFAVVLVAVPIAKIAGVTPLPGGLGALDGVLIALVVALSGIPAATAGAAVVLHRGATYWLPIVLGAAATGVLTTAQRRSANRE